MIKTKTDLQNILFQFLSNISHNDILMLYFNIDFKKNSIIIDLDNIEEFINTILPLYNENLLFITKNNNVIHFSRIEEAIFGFKDSFGD